MYHKELTCGLRKIDAAADSSVFFGSFNDKSRVAATVDTAADEAMLQMSDPSGLTVMLSSKGRVYQSFPNCGEEPGVATVANPTQRVVLADGTVVLQGADGSAQLLFANGNVSLRTVDGLWVSCNAVGARMSVNADGVEGFMPPIDVSEHVDFETQAVVSTRSDGTVVVTHKDATRVVRHADGTTITTSKVDADHLEADTITVQAPKFRTVLVTPATGQLGRALGDRLIPVSHSRRRNAVRFNREEARRYCSV